MILNKDEFEATAFSDGSANYLIPIEPNINYTFISPN